MKLGKTKKQVLGDQTTLSRKYLTKEYILRVDRHKCTGCALCRKICPLEAISLSPPEIGEGRIITRPALEIDENRCNFCGECAVVCPVKSIRIEVDGKSYIPVQEYNVFPLLTSAVKIDTSRCGQNCRLECRDCCPVSAIEILSEGRQIAGVIVHEDLCFYCRRCQHQCPEKAIEVESAFHGMVFFDSGRCPEGCSLCAEICPSKAVSTRGAEEKKMFAKVNMDDRFCIYCGACEALCPAKDAIKVRRTHFGHHPINSAAWNEAIGKMVSENARNYYLFSKAENLRKLILRTHI